jgi:hypothetical protein
MIYQLDTREIFGAIQRCERAHWTAEQAREELQGLADEMQIGRITWDEVDDRTVIGRSELDYLAVVTSVLLPCDRSNSGGSSG